MGEAGKRILIIRLSAAGDVVHGLPVAHALKSENRENFIAWLVEDRFAPLIEGSTDVDEVILLPRRAWKQWGTGRRLIALRDIVGHLRQLNFDVAIDLQGLTKSALAPWLARIPRRIGFAGQDGREISAILNNILITPKAEHVVDRNLELLAPLDISPPELAFPRPPSGSDRVEQFIVHNNLQTKKFVVINPGAGWEAKRWGVEKFTALARDLSQNTDIKVVVTWGGESEEKMAAAIVDGAPKNCIIAPETDLPELWELLSRAALFIGCDTGPLHMAAASGVRCLALFGPTRGGRNGPYGKEHRILQGCCDNHPRCWKKRYRSSCRCMEMLAVKEVSAAAAEMLKDLPSC